ncbi:MAG: hypothetical protein O3C57_08545, partial [Verrucomicrobia bacterium]|nr:hypothetical protein [Verrucomicrobiota bacterium]
HAQKQAQGGWLAERLCRDLRRFYSGSTQPLVVAHPLLVSALRHTKRLYYQHGELVAPDEALIAGTHTVFVPEERTAERFRRAGMSTSQVIVTGLCIEEPLCRRAPESYALRLKRLQTSAPLCGGFFSSGAEPAPHVLRLSQCISSHVQGGGRAIAFCREKGRFHRRLKTCLGELGASAHAALCIETYMSRQELHDKTMSHFDGFDFFAAPSHERSHWAMGLGLPMLIVNPGIGTFAPLNRTRLLEAGVGRDLPNPGDGEFSFWLRGLHHSGSLTEMAAHGWDQTPIQGFRTIAEHLLAL